MDAQTGAWTPVAPAGRYIHWSRVVRPPENPEENGSASVAQNGTGPAGQHPGHQLRERGFERPDEIDSLMDPA